MKGFFEDDPPGGLDDKVRRSVEPVLAAHRTAAGRRRLAIWLALPVAAAAAIALVLRLKPASESGFDPGLAELSEVPAEDLEVVEDLEILEDLDLLENWENA